MSNSSSLFSLLYSICLFKWITVSSFYYTGHLNYFLVFYFFWAMLPKIFIYTCICMYTLFFYVCLGLWLLDCRIHMSSAFLDNANCFPTFPYLFPLCVFVIFLETESCDVVYAIPELQGPSCLSSPSAGITGIHQHTQLQCVLWSLVFFYKLRKVNFEFYMTVKDKILLNWSEFEFGVTILKSQWQYTKNLLFICSTNLL